MQSQLKQVGRMGGMGGILGMLPGVGKIKKQLAEANIDERIIVRQAAIIDSMTRHEKRNPDVIAASRKRRIAAGSGTSVRRSTSS
jgi:signal recognition particle subunit SRP54